MASNSLDIVSSADVSITKTHTGSFTVGTTGTFTLAVANAGPDTSGALTVTDALPAGLTFVSGTGAGWTCGATGATVTCSNATGLVSGGSTSITLTVVVGAAAAPATSNTASVTAVRADPNTANNSSSDPVTVIPIPLAVDDTATTPQGTPVAVAVTTNDNLGATPTAITSHTTPTHGATTCTPSSCTYTPAAGFAGVDSFDYTITDTNGRTSTAKVTITITVTPVVAPVPGTADLATTVHGPASTAPGGVVDLVATVRNNGPAPAAGSTATLTVPVGFTLRPGTIVIDGGTAGGACVVTGAAFTCQLGTLAPGETAQITWQASANATAAPGAHVVRADADSTTTDSVPANNPSSWVIRVQRKARPAGMPRLAVSVTSPTKTVRPGGTIRITVVVSNNGNATADSVVVCLPAPADATFVSAPGAVFRRGSACWSISSLGSHASHRVVVVVRIDRTARPGTIHAVAVATRRGGRRLVSGHTTVTVLPGRRAVRPGGVTG